MVTTPHFDLDIDTTLGGNNASDYVIPSQKAIKSYVDNNSSGGGIVDQTYDGTSANAQSGVAIAGAGFLQNTAIRGDSITLQGTTTNKSYAINIGYNGVVYDYCTLLGATASTGGNNSTAIGYYARCTGTNSTAVGYSSNANNQYATAVGSGATASNSYTLAVGTNATATYSRGTAIGMSTEATAVGTTALGSKAIASANSAMQLGYGTNSTANTLSIGFYNDANTHYNWQLLDGTTGLIPDARISSNIARTSDIPSVSGYLQATNGNTAYTNTGTETTMGYTDTSTHEMYGVIAGKNTTYGTGIILGAQNGGSGYLSTLTTSGLTIMNATNPPNIQTAILTVSNNNLAINGSEVALTSDLTNLADTDLSNLSATGKTVIDGQWISVSESIISSSTSLSASTALPKRITLPDDNHKYEVLIRGSIYTSSSSGKEVFLKVKGNEDSYDRYMARCITRTSSSMYASGTALITASYVANDSTNLTIARDSSWGGNCSELTVVAYRRIGSNT